MLRSIPASELQPGDVFSTSGAKVETVVPSHKGAKVYLEAVFDNGYRQVVTTDADTVVHVWQADDEPTSGI